MGVDPEQMLVENGIASLGWVKHAYPEKSFDNDEDKGDSNDRGNKYLDPRSGI
jgi:hypothetical protein